METELTAASEPPPSYTDVSTSRDAPPTYKSLFMVRQFSQEMRHARATSSNQGVFAMKFCEIICGSICCTICLLIFSAIPVAMIIVGAVHLDDCELQRNIPIFLIVFGCVSLAHTILNTAKQVCCNKYRGTGENGRNGRNDQLAFNCCSECVECLLSTFLLVWFILGSFWVFGKFDEWQEHKDDSDSPDYCHPAVYLFSFIFLVLSYTFWAIVCCCGCVFFCLLAMNVSWLQRFE